MKTIQELMGVEGKGGDRRKASCAEGRREVLKCGGGMSCEGERVEGRGKVLSGGRKDSFEGR